MLQKHNKLNQPNKSKGSLLVVVVAADDDEFIWPKISNGSDAAAGAVVSDENGSFVDMFKDSKGSWSGLAVGFGGGEAKISRLSDWAKMLFPFEFGDWSDWEVPKMAFSGSEVSVDRMLKSGSSTEDCLGAGCGALPWSLNASTSSWLSFTVWNIQIYSLDQKIKIFKDLLQ